MLTDTNIRGPHTPRDTMADTAGHPCLSCHPHGWSGMGGDGTIRYFVKTNILSVSRSCEGSPP